MFGPRDPIPDVNRKAVTFKYVFEGGKHHALVSFGGGKDDWFRIELNDTQVAHFIADSFLKVVRR